ncbi:MAG: redoxin domain-containing protein [Planctomycetaceae bacterium]
MDTGSDNSVGGRSKAMLAFLPIAAIAIAGACAWKLNQKPRPPRAPSVMRDLRQSPTFELPDENSQLVRLDRYLHRHPVLVVFYDGERGPAANPWLKALNKNHAAIESSGLIVVGVSTALPLKNRGAKFKIPLLTDVNPAIAGSLNQVHRDWGVLDENEKTIPSVFYINRGRMIDWAGEHPKAVEDPGAVVKAILQGRDPEVLL